MDISKELNDSKISADGVRRKEGSASKSLLREVSKFLTREFNDSYSKDAQDWMRRAAVSDPELAFSFLKAHSNTPKSGYLAERFAEAFDTETVFAFLARPEAATLTEREREVMRQSAYTKLGAANPQEAFRQLLEDSRLSAEDRKAALGYISVKMPRDQTSMELIYNLPDQTLTGNALGTAMSYWAGEKPAEAAAWLSQHLDSPNDERFARSVAQKWAAKDLVAAGNWVNSLPPGVAKQTGTIYVAQAMVLVDPETGMKWVEQIKNEKWRQVLSEQAQKLIQRKAQNQPITPLAQ